MKIVIGNDHGAVQLKYELAEHLRSRGIQVIDIGAAEGQKMDYPDSAYEVCTKVLVGDGDFGILLCGTGVGMSMSANKIHGIRAVVCSEPYSARLSRGHNNANILCIGARVVGPELAKMITDAFVDEKFEGGRHAERVAKIMGLES